MMTRRFLVATLPPAVLVFGCGAEPLEAPPEEAAGGLQSATPATPMRGDLRPTFRLGDNRLGDNRLGDNRLGDNRLGDNRLGDNRLGDNSLRLLDASFAAQYAWLTSDEPAFDGADEPIVEDGVQVTRGYLARDLMSYVVGCALDGGQSVTLDWVDPATGSKPTWQGQLGLAPRWADEAPTESDQRWVSACVLARTNAFGVRVELSMRGNHLKLATDAAETQAFTLREGAYYGNLFKPVPAMYACAGPGSNVPSQTDRFCSSVGDGCAITTVDSCEQPGTPPVCQLTNGIYHDCKSSAAGVSRSTDAYFPEVITVYLRAPIARCGNGLCEAGETTASCGDCLAGWANAYGAAHEIAGMVRTADGGQVLTGRTAGTDFGGGLVTGAFVTKLSASGAHVWSRSLGTGTILPAGVSLQTDGTVVVAGTIAGSVVLLGETRTTSKATELFAVNLASATSIRWIRTHSFASGPAGTMFARAVVGCSHGHYLTGEFEQPIAPRDTFVARLSSDGSLVWRRTLQGVQREFGAPSTSLPAACAADGLIVAGTADSLWIDSVNMMPSSSNLDAFAAKLSTAGQPLWLKRYGNASTDYGSAVAVGPDGDVYLGGAISFGTYSDRDAFVARFSGDLPASANEQPRWVATVPTTGYDDAVHRLALDPSGMPLLIGAFSGRFAFGQGYGGVRGVPGVVRFRGDGSLHSARTFTGAGATRIKAASVDSALDLTWAGEYVCVASPAGALLPAGSCGVQPVFSSFVAKVADPACKPELCNGVDDDCDGVVDDACELVKNPGFESALAGSWNTSGDVDHYLGTGANPRSGTGYVNVKAAGNSSWLWQTVTLPAGRTAKLGFWLNVTTAEPSTTAQNDTLKVQLRSTSGAILKTYATYSNLDKASAGVYGQRGTFDLSEYAGRTVRLTFITSSSASYTTSFRLDDVSLEIP